MKQESVSVPEEAPRNDFHFMLVEEDAILLIRFSSMQKVVYRAGQGTQRKGLVWLVGEM